MTLSVFTDVTLHDVQVEAWLAYSEVRRQKLHEGNDPPPMPSPDIIGHADKLFRHASIGERSMKGSEAETMQLRKKLYATNTCFGNAQVWLTITPDDLMDPIAAAYAGFVPNPITADMDDEMQASVARDNNDNMAAIIAANPAACAIAFREQLTIFIEEVLGWDFETATSRPRVMTEVIAFGLQVSYKMIDGCFSYYLIKVPKIGYRRMRNQGQIIYFPSSI